MKQAAAMVLFMAAACAGLDESATSSAVGGLTYYVDPVNGSDTNNGLTDTAPFRSLQKAGDVAGPDSIVNLRPTGLYTRIGFGPLVDQPGRWSGLDGHPITIQAYPLDGADAVFDFGVDTFRSTNTGAWVHPCGNCFFHQVCGVGGTELANGDEYISALPVTDKKLEMGTMLDTNTRLLTYSRAEDFCATNESAAILPWTDPPSRPAGGPLEDENGVITQTMIPWTYRGPGLFVSADGYVHIRLSHTHLGIPGVVDYTGSTDPNTIPMSIADVNESGVVVKASHLVFRNLVFQNGGESVMGIGEEGVQAIDVRFDHCTFRGARNVVKITNASTLQITNSEFSALLGPWVSRDDVKSSFSYFDGATDQTDGKCNVTSDSLVVTNDQNANVDISYSEFRDTHDAIYVLGTSTSVHHNLFENVNDEVFFMAGAQRATTHVEIYNNVIRRALDVFSDAQDNMNPIVTAGARYLYRNIIDNRMPTLGFHRQPGDGQPIWRFGSDFKTSGGIGEFHAYHNTIVQASPDTGHLSEAFSSDSATLRATQELVDNLYMTFDATTPINKIPGADYMVATSAGNDWNERANLSAPLRYEVLGNHQFPPGWDAGSTSIYPQFRKVADFAIPHAAPFADADYGPSLLQQGVPLASGDPDTDSSTEIGALAMGSGPVRVGIDSRQSFPASGLIAEAGDYSVIDDLDDDGFETVTLDASASSDPLGPLAAYQWQGDFDGPALATTATFQQLLTFGTYKYFLTVTGPSGTAMDMREVTIRDPNPHSNLLLNPGWENGLTNWSVTAMTATHASHSGTGAIQAVCGSGVPQASQTVAIIPGSAVTISGWLRRPFGAVGNPVILVDWLDASNTLITTQTAASSTSTLYQYRATTFTPPKLAVSARVRATYSGGCSAATYDDLRLRITDNKLHNAHFEEGLTSWAVNHAGARIDTAHARSALAALALGQTDANNNFEVTQNIPVSGTSVVVSGWIRTEGLVQPAEIQVLWNGVGNPERIPSTTGTTPYASYKATLTPPDNTITSMTVRLFVPLNEPGTAYFDDIYVK